MDTVTLLEAVREQIRRWGWMRGAAESEDGLDLVAAFEATSGVPLRDTTPEVDRVVGVFAEPTLDDALQMLASIVVGDPADGPLPAERWAWVHTLTLFNDDAGTDEHAVVTVLDMAIEVARIRAQR